MSSAALRHPPRSDGALIQLLRHSAEPLPDFDAEEFGVPFSRYGDARVVLIGEASHGTSEFYRARAAITRRLIEQHGFNVVAIEGDWPDAARIDRHVRHQDSPGENAVFTRFPSWMWRNHETLEFVRWLHQHNATLAADERVEFRGLDIYSLRASMEAVLGYLDDSDPAQAAQARQRYACLTPWQDDPASYGERVEWGGKDSCEAAVIEQLGELLWARLESLERDDGLFDAAQNARVVRAAEQYYRLMYRASASSWNLRDNHMFDTLKQVLKHRGRGAKAVVWAHNSHIGDAAATAMGWRGEFNLGQLCRIGWGDDAVLIGMGTDRGEVAAADDWGGALQIKPVLPSRPDSWEQRFLHAGLPAALVDWRGAGKATLRHALSEPLLQRAIGVIYRPQTELRSHYYEAVLGEQFDAYLWFESTTAISPLAALAEDEQSHEAETFPFGI
ncbi:erythromycin esterase family protein [Pseudomonas sp. ML96]|uniref:erythromycin esterase family protein n=1 Tax=Pseudomonas sp. ML96 TaxID=1523503 RepID=UPI0005BD1A95|nr:erythromycin esterase family protein [Pseudomonas sp. ML96]